jgi:hypothetical protein
MQKYLARQADTAANMAVIQPKKPFVEVQEPKDVEVLIWRLTNGGSVYFSWDWLRNPYATEVHLSFSFLVVVDIVYIVARLS